MGKGKYILFTCITLVGHLVYLEGRDAADVIDRPAGSVIGFDHSQQTPPHLDQWLESETTQLPPGEQHTALAFYLRPMVQYPIQGTPLPLLQMEDELPFAA